MLSTYRKIVRGLRLGQFPAWLGSLESAIEYYEGELAGHAWENHSERTEAQLLLAELYCLKMKLSAGTEPSEMLATKAP